MDPQWCLCNFSVGTGLALRLEDHLSSLRAELKRIERAGARSEIAALEATINDVRQLIRRFVC